MPSHAARAAVALAFLGTPALVACFDLFAPSESIDVEVVLINVDEIPIHILRPGEGISTSNRLLEGRQRDVTVGYPREGSGVEFRAASQGSIVSAVICVSQDPEKLRYSGTPARVTWNGNRLICQFWDQ